MTNRPHNITIIVIAHNEQKYITSAISAIVDGSEIGQMPVVVYPNGCTDNTVQICNDLANSFANVRVRELPVASKSLTWNVAFSENQSEFLVFSDGDIRPEPGGVTMLVSELCSNPDVVIVSSRPMPMMRGLSLQQKFVGFMQLPLAHEFLYGGFYAVRRQALADSLAGKGFSGIPSGVTGEDCFLEFILEKDQLRISDCRTYYEPPCLKDYLRYLARIRWQNEQLRLILGNDAGDCRGFFAKLSGKIRGCRDKKYLFLSFFAVVTRYALKLLFSRRIDRIYRTLGPVGMDGASILQSLTRSDSTK